jgi:Flp pilus assembly pilin Flp
MYKIIVEDQGTAAIEYTLLISLIGMAVVGVLQALGGHIFDLLSTIDEVLSSVQFQHDTLKRK